MENTAHKSCELCAALFGIEFEWELRREFANWWWWKGKEVKRKSEHVVCMDWKAVDKIQDIYVISSHKIWAILHASYRTNMN